MRKIKKVVYLEQRQIDKLDAFRTKHGFQTRGEAYRWLLSNIDIDLLEDQTEVKAWLEALKIITSTAESSD